MISTTFKPCATTHLSVLHMQMSGGQLMSAANLCLEAVDEPWPTYACGQDMQGISSGGGPVHAYVPIHAHPLIFLKIYYFT